MVIKEGKYGPVSSAHSKNLPPTLADDALAWGRPKKFLLLMRDHYSLPRQDSRCTPERKIKPKIGGNRCPGKKRIKNLMRVDLDLAMELDVTKSVSADTAT